MKFTTQQNQRTGAKTKRPLFTNHYKLFTIVWRNIWRNRRRALITMASVFFAVFFCVVMTCAEEGTWDTMIENTLRTQTGHIQVHKKGYWDDKVVDNFLAMDTATIKRLRGLNNVINVSPRVETFAMASLGNACKGIAVVGVSPRDEAAKSNLPSRVISGAYLEQNDDGALIGEGLSRYLGAKTGDTLAFIGQGYHGVSAAALFPVRGIVHLVPAELDNSAAYISLAAAQQFIGMDNGYSGILIALRDEDKLNSSIGEVQQAVDTASLSVYSWHFTMERLLQAEQSDKAFAKLLLLILYMIVGFGILGTVIMLTNERRREFCTMVSLGMQRRRLAGMMSLEMLLMSLCGVLLALAVTVPLMYLLSVNPIHVTGNMAKTYLDMGLEPIVPMAFQAWIFAQQIGIIAALTLLATLYPVVKILKLNIAKK